MSQIDLEVHLLLAGIRVEPQISNLVTIPAPGLPL